MIINDLFKNKIVTNQQDVAEGSLNELSSDLLQRSAQVAKNKSNQAMDPKIHDALGGGYMNPLAKHYDSLSQKFSNKAMKLGQRDAVKKIASPAVMRKIGMAEGVEYSPVTQAITRRILRQRTDLLAKYGPEKVGNAIDEVADFVGDVEEIGSSDVSGWVRHVEQILGDMQGVAEGRPNVMRHTGDRGVRVVRRGGKPIGEIGIDAEASPGSGQYYVKLYDGSVDLSGYDTAEEALDDLKSALN